MLLFSCCHHDRRDPGPSRADRALGGTSTLINRGLMARQVSREGAPAKVPEGIVEQVHELCLALPEVTVRIDESRTSTRSTAWSFDIRRRSF